MLERRRAACDEERESVFRGLKTLRRCHGTSGGNEKSLGPGGVPWGVCLRKGRLEEQQGSSSKVFGSSALTTDVCLLRHGPRGPLPPVAAYQVGILCGHA